MSILCQRHWISLRSRDQLRKPELVEKYLMPYVNRIERQQKKSKK